MKRVTLLLLAVLLLAAVLTPVLANCGSCPEAKEADCEESSDCEKMEDCEMMKDGACEETCEEGLCKENIEDCPDECKAECPYYTGE